MLLHRLCYGSKCCLMLAALCSKSSGNCEDFKFWCGEEQECTWRTDIEQIFQPNLTDEFYVRTLVHWWMSANPDRKKCVGIKIVSARRGHFGQK